MFSPCPCAHAYVHIHVHVHVLSMATQIDIRWTCTCACSCMYMSIFIIDMDMGMRSCCAVHACVHSHSHGHFTFTQRFHAHVLSLSHHVSHSHSHPRFSYLSCNTMQHITHTHSLIDLHSGRCPIQCADWLPFSCFVDWRSFAVLIPQAQANKTVSVLESIPAERRQALHTRLLEVRAYFAYDHRLRHGPDAFEMSMLEVYLKTRVCRRRLRTDNSSSS